jgi:predicted tellurium resistance membrane protein TerC
MLTDPQIWLSLATLTLLEIVLGIDNIIFIAIMVKRVEESKQRKAYLIGLSGALVMRLGLLFTLTSIMKLTTPLFTLASLEVSGRDLILLFGGAFLIFKSTTEIFHKVERIDEVSSHKSASSSLLNVVVQIMIIDIVFSLDSVITAVGLANDLWVMATAITIAIIIMMVFAKSVGDFVMRHPSVQILALAFLLLIGVLLVAEGFGQHVSKGYVYFAMSFSLIVELFNMRYRSHGLKSAPEHTGETG